MVGFLTAWSSCHLQTAQGGLWVTCTSSQQDRIHLRQWRWMDSVTLASKAIPRKPNAWSGPLLQTPWAWKWSTGSSIKYCPPAGTWSRPGLPMHTGNGWLHWVNERGGLVLQGSPFSAILLSFLIYIVAWTVCYYCLTICASSLG